MTHAAIPKPASITADIDWFVQARFGMFIHWGIYALPARHEWVKQREELDDDVYDVYFRHFNPDLYDPSEWAAMAAEAGMKYVVLTTKHHDGFCLWDSACTDYKVTNTPYGKDLLYPFVDAFRAEGLRIGFYHSLIDWHHPDFPIDDMHAQRAHPERAARNAGRDVARYREYLHNQTRELLTQFGEIDILWYDFSYPTRVDPKTGKTVVGKGHEDWGSEALLKMVRELQPGIIVNNRLDLPADTADIHTPEQFQPREWVRVDGHPVYWEACQTFSGSWGYHRDETTWKSPEQLIKMLINSISCGGNLLMNVGPNARGCFDNRAVNALETYAEWMDLHGRSIYGCTQSAFEAPSGCRYTQRGDTLYLHVFDWPFRHLHLKGLAGRIAYAQLLNDASQVNVLDPKQHAHLGVGGNEDVVSIELPVLQPDVTVPVVEIFLKA